MSDTPCHFLFLIIIIITK